MKPIDPKRRLPSPRRKAARLPSELGDFRLIRKLGGGGATEVYLAEQVSLKRMVALKMIRPGSLYFSGAKERLLAEARAAARIRHPAICPIFDAGEAGGIPFLVMPFIEGRNLAAWIREKGAPAGQKTVKEVLAILAETSRAIHAAHEAGLVHGDIKPANILVTPEGKPVVLDFDMADHEGRGSLEGGIFPGFLGTPEYMAPERLGPAPAPPSPRSDVFSLGVTLYECLTGKKPFHGPTLERVRQNILSGSFPDPRRLNPALSRDLCLVLATAMEEDPEKRYHTALDFAQDLERILRGEPVLARPPSIARKVKRWVSKNLVLSGTLVLLVLALGLTLYFLENLREADQKNRILLRETKALALSGASAHLFRQDQALSLLLARAALEKAVLPQSLSQIQAVVAGIREKSLFKGHKGIVRHIQFSPNGWWLLTRSLDGTARTWGLDGKALGVIGGKKNRIQAACFLPGGKSIFTVDSRAEAARWTLFGKKIASFKIASFPRQRYLLSSKAGFLLTWSRAGKTALYALDGSWKRILPDEPRGMRNFAVAPMGGIIAEGGEHGVVRLRDLRGNLLKKWKVQDHPLRRLAVSPDGRTLATGTNRGDIRIWNREGKVLNILKGHFGSIFHLLFSPDGKWLLSAGYDHTLRLWKPTSTTPVWIKGLQPGFLKVHFSPGSGRIVLVYNQGIVQVYDLGGTLLAHIHGHYAPIQDGILSSTGDLLATVSNDRTARLWSLRPGGYPLLDHALPYRLGKRGTPRRRPAVEHGAFFPGGNKVVTATLGGAVRVWTVHGTILKAAFGKDLAGVEVSPSGKYLLVTWTDGSILVKEAESFRTRTYIHVEGARRIRPAIFSRDGKLVLACRAYGSPRVWTREGRLLRVLPPKAGSFPTYDFFPSGKAILFVTKDVFVQGWTLSGRKWFSFPARGSRVTFARLSPKGNKILLGRENGRIDLVNLQGKVLAHLLGHTQAIVWAEFSSDGTRVVSASKDKTARVWRAADGKPVMVLKGHERIVTCARFSPSGDRVLTCSTDGTARIWELRPDRILRIARRLSTRDFTPRERKEFAGLLED